MLKSLPDPKILYKALLKKDESFEGIFIVGVKTTGIFCRPTCTARKPNQKNVEFFNSAGEALLHGYRPCKVCNPLGYKGEIPTWLQPLFNEVNSNPGIRLRDYDLRKRGVEPHRVRRWFKQHHGMTFQTYLRTLRIGNAFGRIQYGDKIIEAAFDSGYDSLSGFNESFRKTLGMTPGNSQGYKIITVTRILTPLGPMLAGAMKDGICLLEFVDRRMLETQIKRLRKLFNAEFIPGSNKYFEDLNKQIQEYFSGKRKKFHLPLLLKGTSFQEAVWKELRTIPYGNTRSYQEQAEHVGNIQAVRAVAKANGDNRIAIIIPCHRVIGKNGKLTGYGGGLWRKQYLLDHEKKYI
jgi:AraC family transcriptional regulator, regulatory protein of adaptative response / methylated-DNA-[protein]-cysteine methyltransferase